jgi:pantetheine-phosphate adenylyltransferase
MNRTAVFPGSFDPITRGHESLVRRAIPLFDKIIIAIGVNSDKKHYFTLEQRLKWIKETFKDCKNVSVDSYSGLTVDYCNKVKAGFILRGLRTSADFEFERSIGQVNRKIHPDIETVFLLSDPEYASLNSSIVREIILYKGDVSDFVPKGIKIK